MAKQHIKSTSITSDVRDQLNENYTELYNEKVPYSGATGNIFLGYHGITQDFVQFNIDATPRVNAEGLLQWNATDGTLDLGMDGGNITMQVGQEMFIKVTNRTGSLIPNGSAVYISGRTGNRPNISLALGDSPATSTVAGVTTQDIADNAIGYITTMGYVRQIKTDYPTWAEGDTLWLSTTVPGGFTNVEPSVPHYSPTIGDVNIVHSNLGSIFIRIFNNRNLKGLSDVNGSPLYVSGQPLLWDEGNSLFDFYSCWDDLRFPVTQTKLGALDKPDFDYTNNGLLFPQNDASEIVYVIAQMPHGYKLGTDIYPHIHFIQSSSSVPTFKIKYRWYKKGAAVPSFTTITSTTVVYTYTSGSIHQVLQFPAISGAAIDDLSSILDIQFYREDNVVTGDVLVKELDIHYEKDTLGSKIVTTK